MNRHHPECWLARFDPEGRPCDGPLDRVHLIPKSLIRRTLRTGGVTDTRLQSNVVWNPAVYVSGCRFHHGQLDTARKIKLRRECIPDSTEAFAAILGLSWWLEREYGPAE